MKERFIRVQYCDPYSILAINNHGTLRQIYCPFRVQSIRPLKGIKVGTWLIVEEVYSTLKDQLVYSIQGRHFLYNNFSLNIQF